MSKWKLGTVGVMATVAVVAALAHEGHVRNAGEVFDPNAPRRPSAVTAAAIGLRTLEVGFGEIEETVRLSGSVRANPELRVAVAAPVDGMLAALGSGETAGGGGGASATSGLQTGDRVKRGDVVAVLHSPRLAQLVHEQLKTEVEYEHSMSEVATSRASVETLRRQVESTERQAALAEQEAARLKAGADAVNANLLSQREAGAIQARSQVDALKAALIQQGRELESMERRAEASGRAAAALRNVIFMVTNGPSRGDESAWPGAETDPVGLLRLRAPMDGIVVLRGRFAGAGGGGVEMAEAVVPAIGQGVREGQVLLEIADYSRVQVDGELPESIAARVSGVLGVDSDRHEVRVRSGVEGVVLGKGRIRGLAPVIDTVKRTAHLVIDVDNAEGRLRDGMYVDLSVVLRREKSAVTTPLSAIVTDGSLQYVFVKEKGAYVKRDVRLGSRDDRVVEVLDGLVPGDEVVVQGAYALSQLRPMGAAVDAAGHDHTH